MVLTNTKINSLLNEIYLIEKSLEKKKTAKDPKERNTIIDSQQVQLLALLRNRGAEEKILQDIMAKIEVDTKSLEEKSNVKDVATISKMMGFERNFEKVFKAEINVIKKSIIELSNFYEEQELLEEAEFKNSLDYEQKKIIEIKNLLDMIVNSENEIIEHIKEVDRLKASVAANSVYFYLGLRIPSNVKILSPISRYDLEPFLKAYNVFAKELGNTKINLLYARMDVDTMRSQFSYDFIFRKRKNRVYSVLIAANNDNEKRASLLTDDEKVGMYAHELGHIVRYIDMSNAQLFGWFIKYGLSWFISTRKRKIPELTKWAFKHMRKVEMDVDMAAIEKGRGYELAKGSEFFLNKSNETKEWKERYGKIYTPLHENIDLAAADYMKKVSNLKRNSKNNK